MIAGLHAFCIPGEPVAWQRARAMGTSKGVRFFTSPEQRARQELIRWTAKAAGVTLAPEGAPIIVDVVASWLYPRAWSLRRIEAAVAHEEAGGWHPKTTRCDIDNVAKDVGDSLNGIAWADDAQVWMLRALKVWGRRAETHVRISFGDAPAFPARWWR